VRRQFDVVRAVFAYAVSNDLIPKTPCSGVKLPAVGGRRRTAVMPEDVAVIANAMAAAYQPMVWIGAVLGLRWGEVAGLQVKSFDLERGEINVTDQLGRNGQLEPPKSAAGVRTLSLPEPLAALIGRHIAAQGLRGCDPEALVFVAPEGGPIDYTTWRRRYWQPAVAAAGFPGLGFHDLRRTNATTMVSENVDIKTAQTRLGHSDPRLTLAIYAQATTEADRAAARKLGDRFFGPQAS
jgi:integrase